MQRRRALELAAHGLGGIGRNRKQAHLRFGRGANHLEPLGLLRFFAALAPPSCEARAGLPKLCKRVAKNRNCEATVMALEDCAENVKRLVLDHGRKLVFVEQHKCAQIAGLEHAKNVNRSTERKMIWATVGKADVNLALFHVDTSHLTQSPTRRVEDYGVFRKSLQRSEGFPCTSHIGATLVEARGLDINTPPVLIGPSALAGFEQEGRQFAGVASAKKGGANEGSRIFETLGGKQVYRVLANHHH